MHDGVKLGEELAHFGGLLEHRDALQEIGLFPSEVPLRDVCPSFLPVYLAGHLAAAVDPPRTPLRSVAGEGWGQTEILNSP